MSKEVVTARLSALAESARESARQADDDRLARDGAIAEADREGWGLREIARVTKLSTGHVQRIIVAATVEAQQAAEEAARQQQQPETD